MDNLIKKSNILKLIKSEYIEDNMAPGILMNQTTPTINIGSLKSVSAIISVSANTISTSQWTAWNADWKIQGSNDNSTWDDIETGRVTTESSSSSVTIETKLCKLKGYTYYRLTASYSGIGNVRQTLILSILDIK